MTEKTHFYDSQGSATNVSRRNGITNYHLIAYSFSSISAKNYQNRLMCIEVIVCNVSVVFWDTVYIQIFKLYINDKNPCLSAVLIAMHQKLQKSQKRGYYPPSRCLHVNVMLSNIISLWFLWFLIRGC